MKYKTFYLSTDGMVSRHKMRNRLLAGFGMLWEDQVIEATTHKGYKLTFVFEDVKVGSHEPQILITLSDDDFIERADIVTIGSHGVVRPIRKPL